MSAPYVLLTVIGSILGYGFGAGVTWQVLPQRMRGASHPVSFFGPTFWPLTLSIALGIRLTTRLERPKLPRATARERAS